MKKDKLEIKIYKTRGEMGKAAAAECVLKIKELLAKKESINMIFAAAPSQNEFLEGLLASDVDFSRINAFHMDEYVGLSASAPQGFGNFLRDRLFGRAPFKSVNYINGNAENPEQECERYARLLCENKCDIVCMGIGENGHIAFNDPHVARFDDDKAVKLVELDQRCRNQQVNDGCFAKIDDVPTHAITLTIPTLISPEYVFCIVPAQTKAEAVYNTVMGEISETCPASILRKHENATLYLDSDSSSKL